MAGFSWGRPEWCHDLLHSQPTASHKPASRVLLVVRAPCGSLPGVPSVPSVPNVPGIPQPLRPPALALLAVEGRLGFMREMC